ncbi:MAG: 4Fe-4S dicluster domain-containing protein, partial [Chloroflexi bacterium]|nr:4Fe-4S dicluster domain-containing protein [Chloroflexota bacterium]
MATSDTTVERRPVQHGVGPSEEDLIRCVRCGLCLTSCPTYVELGVESDSPRGRIHLMRMVAEGRLPLSDGFAMHMDRCLGCRACEAVCPSGVKYGRIIEATRAQLLEQRPQRPAARLLRDLVFRRLFPSPGRLRALGGAMRLYQRSGIRHLVRQALPGRIAALERLMPAMPDQFFEAPESEVVPAVGERRYRVGLLSGCVMSLAFADANRATVNVLTQNGCEVVIPREQVCCGALHAHGGDLAMARQLARNNIEAFARAGLDAVVLNSAGCGAMMKEYGELLADDPAYAERARRFSAAVRDVSEFLAGIPLNTRFGPLPWRVTYQDPCHLGHAQGIKRQPRQLLKAIPGLQLVEMREADMCCGSAGVYNVLQHDLSMQILDRKMRHVGAVQPEVIVTANPGCLAQLRLGAERTGLKARVMHVVEVLDAAYRAAVGGQGSG